MNYKNIKNALKLFKYKQNSKFYYYPVPNRSIHTDFYICLSVQVTDVFDFSKTIRFKYYKHCRMKDNISFKELKELVFQTCKEWEEHEVKEFLKVNNKHIKTPHPKVLGVS